MSNPSSRSHRIPKSSGRTSKSATLTSTSLNLDELLNFTLPPRNTSIPNGPQRNRRHVQSGAVWNKEIRSQPLLTVATAQRFHSEFVNAQYRFVMKPAGDYVVHFADPDIYLQWQDIAQVIIPRQSLSLSRSAVPNISEDAMSDGNCPICLSPPAAPRMTKCGHIFCYPCVLHYLSVADSKWSTCPLCQDSITETQLKSVVWQDASPHKIEGSDNVYDSDASRALHMRLMFRPQMTTLALPRSSTWPSDAIPPLRVPFHFAPDVQTFAKFMLATPSYLRDGLMSDLASLRMERQTLIDMNDTVGVEFIDAAKARVMEQIDAAEHLETPRIQYEIDQVVHSLHVISRRSSELDRIRSSNMTEDVPSEINPFQSINAFVEPNISLQSTPKTARATARHPSQSSATYYFYQAATGQAIFLHPLDIRILLSKFSSYPSFPSEVIIHVESYTESSVDDDLRKRCKYLAHLPDGADVTFVEADLENVVGREGLQPFEAALKSRRLRRQEKMKRDDRARIRAEEIVRDRERQVSTWQDTDSLRHPHRFLPDFGQAEPSDEREATPLTPKLDAGAWGTRSFASAAAAGQSQIVGGDTSAEGNRRRTGNIRTLASDDVEMDLAWHEFEQRQPISGRRKGRNNKLVILGGVGGRGAR